jgi:hypothetical protein
MYIISFDIPFIPGFLCILRFPRVLQCTGAAQHYIKRHLSHSFIRHAPGEGVGSLKKFLIVALFLLVFVVGVTLSQIDPGNPADGSIHIGEPTHVDRFNLSDQGNQSSRSTHAGQSDLVGQGNSGSSGGQSGSDNPGAPGNPVNTNNPEGSDNPIIPGNPDVPANPINPGNPGDPGNSTDPANQTEQNNDPSLPIPTPEFPSVCIPATYLIGMVGAVLLIKRIKE